MKQRLRLVQNVFYPVMLEMDWLEFVQLVEDNIGLNKEGGGVRIHFLVHHVIVTRKEQVRELWDCCLKHIGAALANFILVFKDKIN